MTPTIRGAAAAKILSKDLAARSTSYFSLKPRTRLTLRITSEFGRRERREERAVNFATKDFEGIQADSSKKISSEELHM
jgi:hypothetical protein